MRIADCGLRNGKRGFLFLNPKSEIDNPQSKGFTLLELMLVVFILSVTALFVFPRVSSFGATDLKRTARHFAGLIQHLAQESSTTKQTYRLYFNLENGAYWAAALGENGEFVETTDPMTRRRVLPKEISFEDVVTPAQGKVNEGEAFMQFYPVGVEKVWIHLKQGERQWTLVVNPLTGRVKVMDEYVDVDDRTK
ncbi:MAG: prepilin-type N-terminal cleavage/methylation domain-containing protein [Candidatus Manganitrophus sp.]|nr:MAG: prepilin-type N-terminal cleavage/methylation domain-containing protein [Candidatus Manganitrophus sp.]